MTQYRLLRALATLLCAALLLPCPALADGLAVLPESGIRFPLRVLPLTDGALWISGSGWAEDSGEQGTSAACAVVTPDNAIAWSLTHRAGDMEQNMLRDVMPLPGGDYLALNIASTGDKWRGVVTRISGGQAWDEAVFENEFGTALLPAGEDRYAILGIHQRRKDKHGGWFYPLNLQLHAVDGALLWRQTYDLELSPGGLLPVGDDLLLYGVLQEQETRQRDNQLALARLGPDGGLLSLATGEACTTLSFGGAPVLSDGVYTLAGLVTRPPDYLFECHVFRFDAQGRLLSDTALPPDVMQIPYSLCATPAGPVLLGKVQGEVNTVRAALLSAEGAVAGSQAVTLPEMNLETVVGFPVDDGVQLVAVGTTAKGGNTQALTLYRETISLQ